MRAVDRLRPLVAGNRDLLTNAGSLIGTTGATSFLGFAYWWLAARAFSTDAVGAAAAAVSAMTLLGSLGTFGFGTLLIGELPKRRLRPAALISAAMAVAGLLSAALGLVFAVVGPAVSGGLRAALPDVGVAAVFVVGVTLTAVAAVLDQALVGLLAGALQLWRNLYFGLIKLAILAVATVLPLAAEGGEIIGAWSAGIALSLALLLLHFRRRRYQVWTLPRPSALRGLGRRSVAHNFIDLALTVPGMLLPLVVTVAISPAANAEFYAAWLIASTLFLLPYHVTTSLFAVASGEGVILGAKLRVSLGLCLGFGVPAALVAAVASPLIMRLFGEAYGGAAATCLAVLALAFVPSVVKQHWVAVMRVQGRLRRAAVVLSVLAVIDVAACATVAVVTGSIVAVAATLGVSLLVQAAMFGPVVLQALRDKEPTDVAAPRHDLPLPQGAPS